MAYGDFKDLNRRTAADKVLRDKVLNVAKNLKYDEYQRGIALMVQNFFDKNPTLLTDKSSSSGAVQSEIMPKQELAQEKI